MDLILKGHSLSLHKPSQNGRTVIVRSYAAPVLDLDPIPRLPGEVGPPPEKSVKRSVREALQLLTSRERLVVQLHFGIASEEPWELREIAVLLHTEVASVKRILLRAYAKLRKPLAHLRRKTYPSH